MNPWIQHVMDVKRKYGLKSLHDAIKKAKMSWKKALLPWGSWQMLKDQSSPTSQVPDSTDFVYSRAAAPKHLVPREPLPWLAGLSDHLASSPYAAPHLIFSPRTFCAVSLCERSGLRRQEIAGSAKTS